MRLITLILSGLSVLSICLTMAAGLKAAHGETLFFTHIQWGFISLGFVLLTVTLALMFIIKMHGIIHELVEQLEEK